MVLLCNGDSWTQGDSPSQTADWEAKKSLDWYDIIPAFGNPVAGQNQSIWPGSPKGQRRLDYKFYNSDVWPKVLGRELGLPTFNTGRLGCSNQTMVRSTMFSIKYLQDKGYTDIFVVVGWTSMYRQEVFQLDDGQFRVVQRRPNDKEWNQLKETTGDMDNKYNFIFVEAIIALQSFLTVNKIPFLFYNAFDLLDKGPNPVLHNYIDKSNWVDGTYAKKHFREYIETKFNTGWTQTDKPNKYFIGAHPTDFSHREWGKYLADYIKDKFAFHKNFS